MERAKKFLLSMSPILLDSDVIYLSLSDNSFREANVFVECSRHYIKFILSYPILLAPGGANNVVL